MRPTDKARRVNARRAVHERQVHELRQRTAYLDVALSERAWSKARGQLLAITSIVNAIKADLTDTVR